MNALMLKKSLLGILLLASLVVVPPSAQAASAKRYGSDAPEASAYLSIRGKKIETFLLSFNLHCHATDTLEEFDVTFTSGSYESAAVVRNNRLNGTFIFQDGSGREVQIDASANLRGRSPVLSLYIQPFAQEEALETCDVQRLSTTLQKLR